MEIFTKAEFESQLEEHTTFNEIAYDVQGFDCVGKYVNKWFEESFKSARFSCGIVLELSNQKLDYDYGVENEHDESPALTSKFYLSGHHGVISLKIENVEAEYSERGGYNYLFYLPDIEEIEQYFAGDRLQRLIIDLDFSYLRSFIKSLDDIPQQLKPLIESDKAPRFHRPVGEVTSMMRTIIEQIWHLEQAQQLLRQGNLTVAMVANEVGYTHLGHFAAAFKRRFGMTPKEYQSGLQR